MLLLALDRIEEGRIEEGEQSTNQPPALVAVLVGTYHDRHAGESRAEDENELGRLRGTLANTGAGQSARSRMVSALLGWQDQM